MSYNQYSDNIYDIMTFISLCNIIIYYKIAYHIILKIYNSNNIFHAVFYKILIIIDLYNYIYIGIDNICACYNMARLV